MQMLLAADCSLKLNQKTIFYPTNIKIIFILFIYLILFLFLFFLPFITQRQSTQVSIFLFLFFLLFFSSSQLSQTVLRLSSSTKALASPIPIILVYKLSLVHQPPHRRHRSSHTIAEAHASSPTHAPSPTRFIILLTHFEAQLISAEAAAAFLSPLLWFSADLRHHSTLFFFNNDFCDMICG